MTARAAVQIAPTRIPLFSGGWFDCLNPRASDVKIEDVAHALSCMPRFTGHTTRFFSVAQHCVNVSMTCSDPRYGLLHDASEAYVVDVPSPVKHSPWMSGYRVAEKSVQRTVYEAFGLDPDREPWDLHAEDERWCATEARDLLVHSTLPGLMAEPHAAQIFPMSQREAERAFLERFCALFPALAQAAEPQRPSWDKTWMSLARDVAQRSYDTRLRVGAVIISADNTSLLSLGYNGNYAGGPNVPESLEPGQSGFIHAELNALLKLGFHDTRERVMYVTHSPCVQCAKCIVNSRVCEVVYETPYRDARGARLLESAGVRVRTFAL